MMMRCIEIKKNIIIITNPVKSGNHVYILILSRRYYLTGCR